MPDPRNTNDAHNMTPLINAYLDGSITNADAAELERWIESDAACALAFSEIALLHRHLTERAQPDAQSAPHKPDAERQRGVGISDPTLSAAGAPIYRKGYEPQPSRVRPFHYAVASIAAALLVACGVAVYLLAFNTPNDPQPTPSQPGPAVATLIQNTGDLRTPHDYPAEGDDYSAGEYTLSGGGSAEFMLTNAVNVKLRGDTRLNMIDDMNVALTRGRVDFVVPPNATGFAVNLPGGARVVDLGTAFTVRIGPDGEAAVLVTEGSVRLETQAGQHILEADDSLVATLDGSVRDAQPVDLPQLASDVVMALEPVALWRFESLDDGQLIDETGTHHGKLVGDAPLTDSNRGLGLDLSQSDAHVVVPAHDTLNAPGDRLTVSAWVNLADRSHQAIVHKWADGKSFTLEVYENRPAFVAAFGPTQRDVRHVASPSPMPIDRWVLLTGVYDGRTVSLYVDGEFAASMNPPHVDAPVHVSRGPLTMGIRSEGPGGTLNGLVDDVAIFNRALTADQIKQIYEAHETQTPVDPDRISDARSESETADR